MKGLNLSKFKKLSSDEKTTTLQHPDGHSIKILHSALAPEMQEQLKKLPTHKPKEQHFEEGGDVKAEAEDSSGKPVTININNGGQDQPQTPTVAQSFGQALGRTPLGMGARALGAIPGAVNAAAPYVDQAVRGFRNEVAGEPLNEAKAPEAEAATAPSPAAPAAATAPSGEVPTSGDEELPKFKDLPKDISAGQEYNLGTAGIALQQKAEQQKAAADLQAAQTHEANLRMQQATYDNGVQELGRGIQDTIQDIKDGHIDPNHFLESKSTLGKVSTAIGLILGGAGGGLTGQENPALKFMNEQINRDVDAQRANMSNRHTLLNAYMKQFDNLNVAQNMTKATELGIYASQLEQAAAKSADPAAKARALQAHAALMGQILPLVQQSQMFRMAQSGGGASGGKNNVDPAAFVPHLVPKEHQAEVAKEIKRAQDTHSLRETILKDFDEAAGDNTMVKRLGGLRGESASSKALEQHLLTTVQDLEGSVRQTAMDSVKKNLKPEQNDLPSTKARKRQALVEYMDSKSAAPLAKGYGIDLQKFRSTATGGAPASAAQQQTSAPREGATGTYQGKPVIFTGGKWQIRSSPTTK